MSFSLEGIGPLSCGPWTLTDNTLYYGLSPDSRPGHEFGTVGDECIGGAWYASAIDLARHASGFRTHDVLHATTVEMMENEVMAWYPWSDGGFYNHNGGLCHNAVTGAQSVYADMMALDDDFDVGLIVNSERHTECFQSQPSP